jgi:hypothetical protein
MNIFHVLKVVTLVNQTQIVVNHITVAYTTHVALVHTPLVNLQQHAAQVTLRVLTIPVRQTLAVLVQTIANLAPVAQVPITVHQTIAALKQQITALHGTGFLTLSSLFLEQSAMLPIAFLQHHTQTQMELKE